MIIIACCIFFLLVNGCTVIGYGLGKLGDTNSPQAITITRPHIIALARETLIKIELMDGNEISGKLAGFKNMSSNEYKQEYDRLMARWQESNHPNLGDTLELYTGDKMFETELIGFDFSYMRVLFRDRGISMRLPLSSVDSIVFHNRTMLDGAQIEAKINEGILPVQRLLLIDCKSHQEYIYMHDIKKAQYYKKPYSGKLVGGLFGMLFDIILLTSML